MVKPEDKRVPSQKPNLFYDTYNFGETRYGVTYAPPWKRKDMGLGRRDKAPAEYACGRIENFNPMGEVVLWDNKENKLYIIDYSWIIHMRPEED